MRITIGSVGLVAIAAFLGFGCSSILGIDNLPSPGDGGTGSSGGDASSSGTGTDGSVSSGGSGDSGTSSGATASGGGASGGGASGGGASGGSGHSADVSAFLGTWQTESGTQTLSNCSNPAADSQEATPTTILLTFVAGTTSDLVGTYSGQDSSGCTFLANVTGTTAAAPPGQTCTEVGSTETDVVTLSSYSFTISGGDQADEAGAGIIVDQTGPGSCAISSSVAYAKM